MLILRRFLGQKIRVRHVASGDVVWLDIRRDPARGGYGFGFDDAGGKFGIDREEVVGRVAADGRDETQAPPPGESGGARRGGP